jgi:hypothetical protein
LSFADKLIPIIDAAKDLLLGLRCVPRLELEAYAAYEELASSAYGMSAGLSKD